MRKIIANIGIFIVAVIGIVLLYRSITMKKVDQVVQTDLTNSAELVIQGKSVDIKLLPSENDEVYVALKGKATKRLAEQFQINTQDKNDVLTIALEKTAASNSKNVLDVFEQSFLKLEVKIPKKQWQKITLETTSGDVSIHNVTADDFLIQSSSGDLHLQQLVTQQLTIENQSGDVHGEAIEAAVLSTDIRSGDLIFKNVTTTDLVTKSTSGTQKLKDVTTKSSQLQATTGDLKITHLVGKNTSIETTSGTAELTLSEPHQQMNISSASGDVSVNYEQKISNLKVTSTHKSGDVSIKLDDAVKEGKETIVGEGSNVLIVQTTSGTFKLRN